MAQILKNSRINAGNIRPLIESFLAAMGSRCSATRLGIDAKNDPAIVFRIRNGAEPRQRTVDQIVRAIEIHAPGFADKFWLESPVVTQPFRGE